MEEVQFVSKSSVQLVDYMGNDQRIIDAARVSTGKKSILTGKDKDLVDYLWRNQHGTPFEKVVFEFYIQTPIFIARQWFRHRIGSFNEMSGRYRKLKPIFFMPEVLRLQNTEGNKQGSNGVLASVLVRSFEGSMQLNIKDSWHLYEEMLANGIANEQARLVLPVTIMTEFYWTVNLRSLFNFLSLRLDSHAQPEIQQPAREVASLVKPLVPWAWEAFEKHTLKKGV